MEKLIKGIDDFQSNYVAAHQGLFERLASGQQPEVLLVTCSDSRICPDLLTHAEPGDVFVLRNAGNIVPLYGSLNGGEGATIEYAMNALQVKHVIVCGHSHCGAMKGLLHPEQLESLPAAASWLMHAEATRRIVMKTYQGYQGEDLLNATITENVLVQLENLRTHPSVAARLARGEVELHGWFYQIETGRVFAYDSKQARFVLLSSASYNGVQTENPAANDPLNFTVTQPSAAQGAAVAGNVK